MNLFFNPSFSIFGLSITYYAICIVAGMIAAMVIGYFLLKKITKNPDDIFDYAIVAIIFGVIGARLYYFIFPNPEYGPSNWADFWKINQGGLAIYGGIIGGGLAVFVACLIKKRNFFTAIDCLLPGVMVAQAMGRWGNFFNQEAYGQAVTNPSLQWFPYAVKIDNKGWHQATFFYESTWNLIGAAIVILLLVYRYRKGLGACFYSVYYGIGRLWIEGLRTDSLHIIIGEWDTGLRVSQVVSVILILVGLGGLVYIYRKELINLWNKLFNKNKAVAAGVDTKTNSVINENFNDLNNEIINITEITDKNSAENSKNSDKKEDK